MVNLLNRPRVLYRFAMAQVRQATDYSVTPGRRANGQKISRREARRRIQREARRLGLAVPTLRFDLREVTLKRSDR